MCAPRGVYQAPGARAGRSHEDSLPARVVSARSLLGCTLSNDLHGRVHARLPSSALDAVRASALDAVRASARRVVAASVVAASVAATKGPTRALRPLQPFALLLRLRIGARQHPW